MTTEPTTQAGHINDAMRARMRIHQAWFAAYPNQPMPEGRDEVERLIAAIEAEARNATGLREEAVAVLTLGGRMPSGSGYLPNRGDAVASLRRIAGYEPLRDAAALREGGERP